MNNNTTEDLLAEIIEQNSQQQKEFADVKKSIDGLLGEISKLTTQLSPTLKPVKSEEMIPRKDADERAKYLFRLYSDMQARYVQVKADNGEMQAKIRYWASNQWAKHLFRWLFIKRHLGIWLVYALFNLCLCLSIYFGVEKDKRIESLEGADLKYRFIRAEHICPISINWVDSVFELCSSWVMLRT